MVYGDIGTSPLYALRECFHGPHAIPVSRDNVFGVLSMIVWSLIIVISIKYLVFVMRADNRGEGGVLSLMSMVKPQRAGFSKRHWLLLAMGLFGAALLYGDGMITPAITVLSALEGLNVITPLFEPYVIPGTIIILVMLFSLQRRGTAGIGAIFGPTMMVWFTVLFLLGLYQIAKVPSVLGAINPWYAVRFISENGWHSFLTIGSVFLVVTGGESLYADMGHFGKKPIRLAWFTIVFPALVINYFGQGALLLHTPQAAPNPLYYMGPKWTLYPFVALATIAACVASQAVISGAFSLTRQAAQLGYSPRVSIRHTSDKEIGQIYIPAINWVLMFAAIALVIGFKTSSNMAAAYGVAVTTTMTITTILFYVVARRVWHWRTGPLLLLTGLFLVIDLAFFGANIIKVPDGGWVPLAVALFVYTLMSTWRKGREILNDRLKTDTLPIDLFMSSVAAKEPIRVPGTAIFMFRTSDGTPPALLHNIKHNKVLHQQVIFMTVITEEISYVLPEERYEVNTLGHGLFQLKLHFGYMEKQNIPEQLARIDHPELNLDPAQVSYFLGRETLIASHRAGMAIWRERLFGWMTKNATSAAAFFGLPPNRVVELGAQIEL